MKKFEQYYITIKKINNLITETSDYVKSIKFKEILDKQLNNNDILLNEAELIASTMNIKLNTYNRTLDKFNLDTKKELSDSNLAKTMIISVTSIICELVEEINNILDKTELEIYSKLKNSIEKFTIELKQFL